jgi:hypothetical protein
MGFWVKPASPFLRLSKRTMLVRLILELGHLRSLLMATKADFDSKFARFDTALTAIEAKVTTGGMTAAEEDQVLADLETHVASLESVAK